MPCSDCHACDDTAPWTSDPPDNRRNVARAASVLARCAATGDMSDRPPATPDYANYSMQQHALDMLAALDELNRAWHFLPPWPDSVAGIAAIKQGGYIVGPLSNGNTSLLLDMAKAAGLPWDLILGADVSRAYKPDPEAYLRPDVRAGISVFSQLSCDAVDRAVEALGADLETGRWHDRHRELLTMDELHLGYYVITAEPTSQTGGRT